MDKITLQGATDFALTTDALAFMQSAYEALERIAGIGGENYIVSGCTVSGSTATSGWMFLKGKLMPFQGGSIQTNVRIIEEVNTVNVDVASRQQTTYRAEFGTSADSTKNVSWADIQRPAKLVDVFSKTEVYDAQRLQDNGIMLAAQNLSDLADKATARTNLDVYPKSSVYTKTEIDVLHEEEAWHEATLAQGSSDLSSQVCALKKKGNVVHFIIRFRFNNDSPSEFPQWNLPDWALASDPMFSNGRQHECFCFYQKIGSTNVQMLPASFYSGAHSIYPKKVVIDRGYAEGSVFGHSTTGNDFQAVGTYIV